jgi:hypothetical protein
MPLLAHALTALHALLHHALTALHALLHHALALLHHVVVGRLRLGHAHAARQDERRCGQCQKRFSHEVSSLFCRPRIDRVCC